MRKREPWGSILMSKKVQIAVAISHSLSAFGSDVTLTSHRTLLSEWELSGGSDDMKKLKEEGESLEHYRVHRCCPAKLLLVSEGQHVQHTALSKWQSAVLSWKTYHPKVFRFTYTCLLRCFWKMPCGFWSLFPGQNFSFQSRSDFNSTRVLAVKFLELAGRIHEIRNNGMVD